MKLSISMTCEEQSLGWLFLVVQLLFLPLLLIIVSDLFGFGLTDAELNFLMFCINFFFTLAIFYRFLWASARLSLAAPWHCLRSAFLGFLIYFAGNLLVNLALDRLAPDFVNANDENIITMTDGHGTLMTVGLVFLVPIAEETLYRGLIFRWLHEKSRVAAYCVSIAVFSAIHVVGYIGTVPPLTLVLSFLQYIPASFALAWAYERADSIWAPILIHMTVNQIATNSLR